MKTRITTSLVLSAGLLAATATAHVSISSGPAPANASSEVNFQIAHGCESGDTMADTVKLVIDIPEGVTSVRPMPNAFGKVSVTTDPTTKAVTTVTYEKAAADALPSDSNFYKFTVRLKTPDKPFTKLYFKAHQYCVGIAQPTEWVGLPDVDAGGAEPAAELVVMPARQPGWNKYTVPVDISNANMKVFFKDALIVWKGTSAFSANATTLAQIKAESGVTELTELKANDEITVRY